MESQPKTKTMLSSHAATHQGKIRDHNEDAFLDLAKEDLWVVADGAGGHEKGEVASQLIVSELAKFQHQDTLSDNVAWLVERLRSVNKQLIEMREELAGGGLIGSTVVALLIQDGHAVCLWSGDSRIYLYRKGALFLLTQDHNRREEFMRTGFKESELKNYPASNQLTKAVGAAHVLSLDVQQYEVMIDDVFLLCSDGLSGELEEAEIIEKIESGDNVQAISEALIAAVLNYRAGDNVTVLTVGPVMLGI